eukprot:TRINITY_DN3212_c0_g2_i12.p1 TRINITY_DN3212_c0_g2~~TRINITY_DN3212_c0_g2_i12.p1  ORF type:complete len:838 (-),score=67.46 TRINITY_DN3212_c0_g2_i12:303-2816(-)
MLEQDGEDLWTPSNQQSFNDREYVLSLYPDYEEQVKVLCAAQEGSPKNILRKSSLLELINLWRQITEIEVEYKDDMYSLERKCSRANQNSPCRVQSILDVWQYDVNLLESSQNILADVNTGNVSDAYGRPLNMNYIMGGTTQDDVGDFKTAELFQILISLTKAEEEINGRTEDRINWLWTNALIDLVYYKMQNEYLNCYVSSITAIDKVSTAAVLSDTKLLLVGYALILSYTMIVLFRNSPVYCKSHIAPFSIIAVILAIASAFGFVLGVGITFNQVNYILPFLLLGLGIDDSFIIIGAYFKQIQTDDSSPTVELRISNTMSASGTSITVTSITDLATFAIGRWSDLPALRDFSVFAAFGILFTYLYQIIFFTAVLALDARREDRAKKGAKYMGFGRLHQEHDIELKSKQQIKKDATSQPVTTGNCVNNKNNSAGGEQQKFQNRKCCGVGDFDISKPTIISMVIGQYLPMVTLSTPGKIIFILLEIGLVVAGIYGATRVRMDFQYREWFVPDGSWLKDAFNLEREYFDGNTVPFYVYTKQGDYFENRDQLKALAYQMGINEYVSNQLPVESWYLSYDTWLDIQNFTANDEQQFYEYLQIFLENEGKVYEDNIIFDTSDNKSIISSRIRLYTVHIQDSQHSIDVLDSYRETASKSAPSFSPIPYAFQFLFWDGFRVITQQTIRNVVIAGVTVFVITLLLLANLLATILVLLMVVMTDICLIGFMWYVGLTFNTVTAISLVLAVGLAVDYSAHIAHSYLVVQGTKSQRAQLALANIGGEVFSGGFTTLLGVVVMGAAVGYVFQTFFKMFFALIVLGLWHGIVILPIALSLVGPRSYNAR